MTLKVKGVNYTNTHSTVQISLARGSLHSLPPTSFGCLDCLSLSIAQLLRLLRWFPLSREGNCCVSEVICLCNMFDIAAFPCHSLLACSILQFQTQVSLSYKNGLQMRSISSHAHTCLLTLRP